jgi:hypothetical protein
MEPIGSTIHVGLLFFFILTIIRRLSFGLFGAGRTASRVSGSIR